MQTVCIEVEKSKEGEGRRKKGARREKGGTKRRKKGARREKGGTKRRKRVLGGRKEVLRGEKGC